MSEESGTTEPRPDADQADEAEQAEGEDTSPETSEGADDSSEGPEDSAATSAEADGPFAPGTVVADRFKIVRKLGSSAGGDVFLAMETERNRRMALKNLKVPYEGDEGYQQLREDIKQASSVRHKNLLQVFGLGREGEHLLLAMEYVEGETLHAHLKQRRERGQIMGLKAAYSLIAHLCNALQAVHDKDMVHGALTPRNIWVTPQGRVKVANLVYGQLVAKHLAKSDAGAYFDSPFIAPEVKEDPNAVTPAADVYSLGLITAEVLADLSLEQWEESPEEFIEAIAGAASTELQEVLFSAIVSVPSVRQQSVRDFKKGLKEAVDAPGDNQISSIVVKPEELEKLAAGGEEDEEPEDDKKDLFDLPDLPDSPKDERALFESEDQAPVEPTEGVEDEDEIWLVSKEGLDYGPFGKSVVLDMLYKDEINENNSVLNMVTQRRADLVDIPEFRDKVLAYIPEREERLRKEAAERARKVEQVKTTAKVSTGLLVAAGLVIVGLSVFAYLQLPDPVPVKFSAAITTFPHTFEVPKVEEVALNVDTSQATAIFDPAASAEAREEALKKWEEEHRKRIEAKKRAARKRRKARRSRRRRKSGGDQQYPDQMEDLSQYNTISMEEDEHGNVLEPLDDWEVEEQLYSSSSLRKQSACFQKHSSSKSKVVIKFVIIQSGRVKNVRTNVSGGLDGCLKRIFRGMRFRKFGGTTKRVSYPIEFG